MAWNSKIRIGKTPLLSIGRNPLGIISIGVRGSGFIFIGLIGNGFICISPVGFGFISVNLIGFGVVTFSAIGLGLLYAFGYYVAGIVTTGYAWQIGFLEYNARDSIITTIIETIKQSVQVKSIGSLVIFFGTVYFLASVFTIKTLIQKRLSFKEYFFMDSMAIVKKSKIQEVLIDYASNKNKDEDVRSTALRKVKSEDVIANIAMHEAQDSYNGEQIIKTAVYKINNPNLLLKIGINKQRNEEVIKAVVRRMQKQETLAELAKGLHLVDNAYMVIKKINDPLLLHSIALTAKSEHVAALAVQKIFDRELLQKIINESKRKTVKNAALERITHRITYLSVKMDCPHCGQPVFPGGPVINTKCNYCLSDIEIGKEFWIDELKSVFTEHVFFGEDCFDYEALKNIETDSGKGNPKCINCENELKIDLSKIGKKHAITCSSCNHKNSSFPVPEWMKGIKGDPDNEVVFGSAEQIYCAVEDEKEKKIKKSKPVAINCVQCGGTLQITAESPRTTTCAYCNTAQYLPDPLWRILHPVEQRRTWYIYWGPVVQ